MSIQTPNYLLKCFSLLLFGRTKSNLLACSEQHPKGIKHAYRQKLGILHSQNFTFMAHGGSRNVRQTQIQTNIVSCLRIDMPLNPSALTSRLLFGTPSPVELHPVITIVLAGV